MCLLTGAADRLAYYPIEKAGESRFIRLILRAFTGKTEADSFGFMHIQVPRQRFASFVIPRPRPRGRPRSRQQPRAHHTHPTPTRPGRNMSNPQFVPGVLPQAASDILSGVAPPPPAAASILPSTGLPPPPPPAAPAMMGFVSGGKQEGTLDPAALAAAPAIGVTPALMPVENHLLPVPAPTGGDAC